VDKKKIPSEVADILNFIYCIGQKVQLICNLSFAWGEGWLKRELRKYFNRGLKLTTALVLQIFV